jgi:hypothetical protein
VDRLSSTQKSAATPTAMKMPMCRPWSSGSPQKTGSFVSSKTSLETGIDAFAGSDECSGPLVPKKYRPM